jgi:hypothetical protein
MSNLTPFEIRLELLKMARDMLSEDFHGKCQQESSDWSVKVDTAKINGGQIPDHPSFPPYPAEAEIIAKAQALNGFVSNISVDKPKAKSST